VNALRSASAPGRLALVWFCCFVLSLAVPFILVLRSSIEIPTVLPAIEQISALYAPHLGTVLAFYFAARTKAGRRKRINFAPFVTALLVSAVWNAVVAGTLLLVPIGRMTIEDALAFAGGAGPKLSWLVAPALGYFFAKPGDPA
jgi:hypothetical protein